MGFGLTCQGNCLRRWSQLSWVVQSGQPASRGESIRGSAGDQQSFIGAMHVLSAPVADEVIGRLQPLHFTQVLDIGGASGTWTMALLKAMTKARAIIFDLPEVIPLARQRLADTPYRNRIELVAGDLEKDELPKGAAFWRSGTWSWTKATPNQWWEPCSRSICWWPPPVVRPIPSMSSVKI